MRYWNSEILIQKYFSKNDMIFFSLILLTTLLSLSSLLRANILYVDDIGRAFGGYGWDASGRPLATGVMQILSGGRFLLDLSPATQILAACIMSIAAYVLVRHLLSRDRSVLSYLVILLVTLNPYFLQIYAYRYDALPYAAGFLLAVLAALVLSRCLEVDGEGPRLVPQLRSVLVAAALLFGSLSLYQPSGNAFFISVAGVILITTQTHNFDGKSLRAVRTIFLGSVMAAVLALSLYWAMIQNFFDLEPYAQERAAIDIANSISIVFTNLKESWILVFADWYRTVFGLVFAVIALCAIGRLGYEIIFSLRTARAVLLPHRFWLCPPLIQLSGVAAICLFATIGIHLINIDPLLQPRAFASFGAAFAVFLIYGIAPGASILGGSRMPVFNALIIMPVIWLVGFALTFGNAAAHQDRYNHMVAEFIVTDAITLNDGQRQADMAFYGSPGFAPAIRYGLVHKYPLMTRLIKPYPSNDFFWGYQFLRLAGLETSRSQSAHCYELDRAKSEVVKNNGFYKVSRQQDCLIYDFRGAAALD